MTRQLPEQGELVKFVAPGIDLLIPHVAERPRILQSWDREIYVVADDELLHVEPGFQLTKEFHFDDVPRDVQVIRWNSLLIAAALASNGSYGIYAKKKSVGGGGGSDANRLQRIVFPGQVVRKAKFFIKDDQLFFVTVAQFGEKGKIR